MTHPSIIKFIGYNPINYSKEPYPVIITEFASNGNLYRFLSLEENDKEFQPIDDTQKLIIIYGITAGMSFLHSYNILHRNLSSKNILLDRDLYPKISGFSLSKEISEESDQIKSGLVGTPAYLAPEILLTREYSKMSDVYAFSLIMYQIVTKETQLFEYDDDSLILFEEVKNKKKRPNFNKKIPKCYQDLIEKCWSQEPLERPTFDDILTILRTDSTFLTDQVNKEKFFKYVKLIDTSKKSFDANKKIHHLDHIIKTQLQFFPQRFRYSFNDMYSTHITPVLLTEFSFDFNNFEKHEKIGEGSFGKAFKIVNKESGLTYVAKESLHIFTEFDIYLLKNLRREADIMSELKFPSIVKFFGFNLHNIKNKPKPTFVLEYMPNGSLSDLLEIERKGEKVPEWNDTKKLITIYGIAAAINFLHSNYVIHRDIKPSNILFDEYLFPKLTDFGFSRITQNSNGNNSIESQNDIPATPEYVAPEIFTESRYTLKVDIYSFAIVFYEIITSEKPYKELKNPVDIFNEVSQNDRRPKFNNNIPDCYRDLIEKCWQSDASERPGADEITQILKTNPDFITHNVR